MKTEIFEFAGYGNTNLPAVLWLPEGQIKAVLQIAHGMTEHMGRYQRFAPICAAVESQWQALTCGVTVRMPVILKWPPAVKAAGKHPWKICACSLNCCNSDF